MATIEELEEKLNLMSDELEELKNWKKEHQGIDWGNAGISYAHPNIKASTLLLGDPTANSKNYLLWEDIDTGLVIGSTQLGTSIISVINPEFLHKISITGLIDTDDATIGIVGAYYESGTSYSLSSGGVFLTGSDAASLRNGSSSFQANAVDDNVANHLAVLILSTSTSDDGTSSQQDLYIRSSDPNGNDGINVNFMNSGNGINGRGVIGIGNSNTAPAANPVGGGYLYVVAGALTWRGSSGTITTLGAA